LAENRPKSRKLLFAVIGIWVFVCLAASTVGVLAYTGILPIGPAGPEGQNPESEGIQIDEVAPDFSLQNSSGETVRLSDLRGKPVVINFWATWCGPCVREMPALQRYQDKYPDFILLGIDEGEKADVVKKFTDKMKLTYRILIDEKGTVANLYKVMIMPTTYFVNRDGIIHARHFGYMGEDQLEFYLGSLGIIIK
jgi:cytochrome c biogenesis protein CcmG/thiol:disulfide interchange protein DsbE